jgi:hypothetical protein
VGRGSLTSSSRRRWDDEVDRAVRSNCDSGMNSSAKRYGCERAERKCGMEAVGDGHPYGAFYRVGVARR